jgi:signal transduction histidine kinase/ligand-binding sensor domain-containing protein/DNA-binding response OmpR family regulator
MFRFVIFLLLFTFSLQVEAGNRYRFRTLSPEGGFLYDGILSILQDKSGFIWILMDNDLCRFDGYEYKHYYAYFTVQNPAKEWTFSNMAIDSQGTLFVNTNNGLYRYDQTQDTFRQLDGISVDIVKTDAKDRIWVWKNYQWSILNPETYQQQTPVLENTDKSPTVSPLFCCNKEDIYVCSYGKIYRFNESKNEYSLCLRMPHPGKRILYAKAHKGKLWALVQDDGIYKIDLSTFSIETHSDFFKENGPVAVRAFYIDKNGAVWIGTINGLYVRNPATQEYTHYRHSLTDPFSLPNNSVWTIDEDNQKNVWIGTYAGAVCYVNLDEKVPFSTYFPQNESLSHIPVSAFAEDEQSLWIGTEGGGINRMDKQTGRFSYYSHANTEQSLAHNNVKSLVLDSNQNLWVAMFSGGLDCLHIPSRRFQHFKHSKDNNSLKYNNVRKIIPEGNSGLWIAYQARNLTVSFFDFHTRTFSHLNFAEKDKNYYIFDILRGKDNQLWILSSEKLYLLDTESRSIRGIEIQPQTFMNFQAFCMDDSGNLWIGTIGNGLVKYNPDACEYRIYDDLSKYNFSSIYSICYDDERNIWMGTNNGLIQYNIDGKTFYGYDKDDGVQGLVYHPLASMKGMNGYLYFGGTNGFTIVNPSEVMPNTHRPRAIISDFYIDYSPASSLLALSRGEIVLNHRQENFGFQFSSDNYLIPEKNLFRYRLKGYYDEWIETGAANRTIQYSKVKPGNYYFEVEAANNDGLWSGNVTSIKIVRKTSPWLNLPAFIIYLLIISVICHFVIHHYRLQKKLELQLYLENMEKNKQEKIHQSQLRFFTNISHDFKTPLSLIIASVEKLHQEGLKEYYYRILNRNARRLLNLVNEIMDLRTIENGKLEMELRPTDIKSCVQEIAADFADYALQRDIHFTVHYAPNFPEYLLVDANILEKIILNLLNNSFRFTPQGGTITLELLSSLKDFHTPYQTSYTLKENEIPDNTFLIVVRDSGVGIKKEAIDRIFDRFYKSDSGNTDAYAGTGVGLSLVKSLVLLHKGVIMVYSEVGKGSDIAVCLPLEKAQPEKPVETVKEVSFGQEEILSGLLQNEKKRILLVEDNEDLRNLLTAFLSSDYEITPAADGMEASEILSAQVIDMVVSDIMMPKKDGVALCSEIKTQVETSHIPVILLTAKTGIESKIEGADSGADVYLEKPVDCNLLKLSIQNIFKRQQQLKEYYAKNHYADSSLLASNERENKFLKRFVQVIDDNMSHPELDVDKIGAALSMSRSKLYRKVKEATGKSIVEFILKQRLLKAARLIIEKDLPLREVMDRVGIESQPYFTRAFKKEFGETPAAFAHKHRKQ